jgi:hypothetical protein
MLFNTLAMCPENRFFYVVDAPSPLTGEDCIATGADFKSVPVKVFL